MLSDCERQLLALVDEADLHRHLDAITAVERLAGGAGEGQAAEYIRDELEKAGIEVRIHRRPAILSNPVSGRLAYKAGGSFKSVSAKTRSFSLNTDGRPVAGRLVYLPAATLPASMLEFQISSSTLPQDLVGAIVLSESAAPAAVLACARRGAAGFVHWWSGGEELIHEGIVNPLWGTPQPGEDILYPTVPVMAVSGPVGSELRRAADDGAEATLATVLAEAVTPIPVVEAVIGPAAAGKEYLLIGNHLDSWFAGVTDNGTGNALAVVLAKALHECRGKLRYGARILWWSGHSNGRYAGSAGYACDNFADLARNCLAYMNIDMPGIRGATDYSRITAGRDLYDLARQAAADVTGTCGDYAEPVRGWDQSFLNIGISPYFIWASTLPAGHPDATGNSFMPWWWHTEKDGRQFCDPAVLLKDSRLYLLAAWRLLNHGGMPFCVPALVGHARQALAKKMESYRDLVDLRAGLGALDEVVEACRRRQGQPLPLSETLFIIRRINRLLYVEKGSHLQDWAVEQGVMPGLEAARLLGLSGMDERQRAILRHYVDCQVNRIADICEGLRLLLRA